MSDVNDALSLMFPFTIRQHVYLFKGTESGDEVAIRVVLNESEYEPKSTLNIFDSKGRRFTSEEEDFDLCHRKYSSIKESSRFVMGVFEHTALFIFDGVRTITIRPGRSITEISSELEEAESRMVELKEELEMVTAITP